MDDIDIGRQVVAWPTVDRWYKLYDKVSPAISLKQRIYLYCIANLSIDRFFPFCGRDPA